MSDVPYNERELEKFLSQLQVDQQRTMRDAVSIFRPMEGEQEDALIALCCNEAKRLVVRGGNRSGKTLLTFAAFASAITKLRLHDSKGNELPFPFPDRPLKVLVCGWDLAHIGHTVHDRLFSPGAFHKFRMLPEWSIDQRTIRNKMMAAGSPPPKDMVPKKGWRVLQPWNDKDLKRHWESQPHDALIPPRFYDRGDWTWTNKGENQFSIARTKFGDEIYAYGSQGEPPQGVIFDLILVDEDVAKAKVIEELITRTVDSGGIVLWSAWPHSKNRALRTLSKQAEADRRTPKPRVVEVKLTFSANDYMDAETKKNTLADWSMFGEGAIRARDKGEYLDDLLLMYPGFDHDTHVISLNKPRKNETLLPAVKHIADILRKNDGQPPLNWRRDLALDPGSSICAALFGCVPDPEDFYLESDKKKPVPGVEHLEDRLFRVIYKVLYMRNQGPSQHVEQIHEVSQGQCFQSFIIDQHGSQIRSVGSEVGNSVIEIYQQWFEQFGLVCVDTGSSFVYGNSSTDAGCGIVRDEFKPRKNGTPGILIVEEFCGPLITELDDYKQHITNDEAQGRPALGQKDHACDGLRYYICHNPVFIRPEEVEDNSGSRAYRKFLELEEESDFDGRPQEFRRVRAASPIGA